MLRSACESVSLLPSRSVTRRRPKGKHRMRTPKGVVDDLTAILGIGITLQNRLNRAGIMTYADLAEAKPE